MDPMLIRVIDEWIGEKLTSWGEFPSQEEVAFIRRYAPDLLEANWPSSVWGDGIPLRDGPPANREAA